MQIQRNTETARLNYTLYRLSILLTVIAVLTFFSINAHAKDLLVGTMADASDTISGTGKKWLLLIDFTVSLGAFVMTKKPLVLFSVLGVMLGISGLLVLIQ